MEALEVPGEPAALETIANYVGRASVIAGLDRKSAYKLRLAVEEVCSNIIIHGYQEAGLKGKLLLQAQVEEGQLTITVEDSARPFDPHQLPPPDLSLPPQTRPIGGLGVYLARRSVDQFIYRRHNGRNQNILVVKSC